MLCRIAYWQVTLKSSDRVLLKALQAEKQDCNLEQMLIPVKMKQCTFQRGPMVSLGPSGWLVSLRNGAVSGTWHRPLLLVDRALHRSNANGGCKLMLLGSFIATNPSTMTIPTLS